MIIFCDSFDHYTTSYLSTKGWTVTGDVTIDTSGGRGGGGGLKLNSTAISGGGNVTRSCAQSKTLVVGFAIYIDSLPPTNPSDLILFQDSSSGATQVGVQLNTDGTIGVYSSTNFDHTSTKVVPTEAFFYLEVKVEIDSVSGSYEVRSDEETILSGSGLNTQQTANAYVDQLSLAINEDTGWFYKVDDFYLVDTQPSTYGLIEFDINTDFLGNIEVDALYPDADSPSYLEFSPSVSGASHYTLLDETTVDESDFTFNEIGVTSALEQVTFSEPEGDRLLAIQPVATVKRIGAATLEASQVLHDIGTEGWLSGSIANAWPGAVPRVIGTTVEMMYAPLNHNPTTGEEWAPNWVTYLEFGVKRDS